MQGCFDLDPQRRPTCEDLLKEDYFDQKFLAALQEHQAEQRRREKRERAKDQREKNHSRTMVTFISTQIHSGISCYKKKI